MLDNTQTARNVSLERSLQYCCCVICCQYVIIIIHVIIIPCVSLWSINERMDMNDNRRVVSKS